VRKNIFLALILLFFLSTRFYKISQVPGSLYWDEASIGYNAYSVLKTGKDEWGEFLPLHFRAFGEFKLPVYIYSVLAAEWVFGLTQFSVRAPAVIYGAMAVLGLYLLMLKVSRNKTIALVSSFLFSITPWFFIFSRTGYEATAGLAFFIFALYFLIQAFTKKWQLALSVFCFILAMYSYNSFRILTPLFLAPGLFVFALRTKKRGVYPLLISLAVFFLSLYPIYRLYVQDVGLVRYQTVASSESVLANYLSHFSYNFLFSVGDPNPRSQIPGTGQLYLIDLPFLILGLIYIFKKKSLKYFTILAALLVSFVPAAITKESPHALRSILTAPVLAVISSLGIYWLAGFFKKYYRFVLAGVVGLYLVFFGGYFCRFLTSYNESTSVDWQEPYKEIFTNQKGGMVIDKYGQPYIFALFYTRADPEMFRDTKQLNPVSDWGFSTVKSFNSFEFVKHE